MKVVLVKLKFHIFIPFVVGMVISEYSQIFPLHTSNGPS